MSIVIFDFLWRFTGYTQNIGKSEKRLKTVAGLGGIILTRFLPNIPPKLFSEYCAFAKMIFVLPGARPLRSVGWGSNWVNSFAGAGPPNDALCPGLEREADFFSRGFDI